MHAWLICARIKTARSLAKQALQEFEPSAVAAGKVPNTLAQHEGCEDEPTGVALKSSVSTGLPSQSRLLPVPA
eukprot:CAMPEP_0115252552 /NCGR_PEP_ID=MMETSP0270-20121206/44202_1 /TAXON_ID=71861 /ORGANISM="Scrippsiella trochoidea, Strain CCMP3099" /LENGTH=72 /DNA_ID=CAMNT_0002668003 /DNA_START=210 /DNA_END=424 /DNA_ORIENTATION=-